MCTCNLHFYSRYPISGEELLQSVQTQPHLDFLRSMVKEELDPESPVMRRHNFMTFYGLQGTNQSAKYFEGRQVTLFESGHVAVGGLASVTSRRPGHILQRIFV